jgi:hypothetical protein
MATPFEFTPISTEPSFDWRKSLAEAEQRKEQRRREDAQRIKQLRQLQQEKFIRDSAAQNQMLLQAASTDTSFNQPVTPANPFTNPIDPTAQPGTPGLEKPGLDFGNWFGSGVIENVAQAGINTVGLVEGSIARLLPGEQEFDRALSRINAQRERTGEGSGGLSGFIETTIQAAQEAGPSQRLAEYGASLGMLFQPAVAERAAQLYKEATGKEFSSGDLFSNADRNEALRAVRQAYLETDQPKFVKGVLEFALDPLNFVPTGVITNSARKAIKGLQAVDKAAELTTSVAKIVDDGPSIVRGVVAEVDGYIPEPLGFASASVIDATGDAGTVVAKLSNIEGLKLQDTVSNLNKLADEKIASNQAGWLSTSMRNVVNRLENSGMGWLASPLRFTNPVGTVKENTLRWIHRRSQVTHTVLQEAADTAVLEHLTATGTLVDAVRATQRITQDGFLNIDGNMIRIDRQTSKLLSDELNAMARKITDDDAVSQLFKDGWTGGRSDLANGAASYEWLSNDVAAALFDIKYIDDQINFVLKDRFKSSSIFGNTVNGEFVESALTKKFKQDASMYSALANNMIDAGIPLGKAKNLQELIEVMQREGAYTARRAMGKKKQADGGIRAERLNANYEKQRTLFGDDVIEAIESGNVIYGSAEDALTAYTRGMYAKIANIAFDKNVTEYLVNHPAEAAKYGVRVLNPGEKLTAAERKAAVQLGVDKKTGRELIAAAGETPATERRLFDNLIFSDARGAGLFGRQVDMILKDGSVGNAIKLAAQKGMAPLTVFSEVSRMMGSGFDAGTFQLYALPVLGKASGDIAQGLATGNIKLINQGKDIYKGWARATKASFASLVGNRTYARNIVFNEANKETLELAIRSGLTFNKGMVEAFEAAHAGSRTSKFFSQTLPDLTGADVGELPGFKQAIGGFKRLQSAADASYSDFLTVQKFEMFKAMTRNMDPITDAAKITEIATFINKATGTLSSAYIGTGKLQRQLEASFMFFSPRMTRSLYGLVADAATRPGQAGNDARKAVIGGLTAAMGTTWLFGQMLGQDVELDPLEPHYLQIKIGDAWIGPSGKLISIFRAANRMMLNPDSPVEALFQEYDEDGSFKDQDWFKNVRAQINAPTGSAVFDFLTGETFLGDNLEGPQSYAWAQGQKLLPFWAQSIIDGDPAQAVAADILGSRTRATTVYERNNELLDKASGILFDGRGYKYLENKLQQAQVRTWLQGNEVNGVKPNSVLQTEFAEYESIMDSDSQRYGVLRSEINDYFDRSSEIKEEYNNDLQRITAKATDTADWYKKWKVIKEQRKSQKTELYTTDEFANVRAYFDAKKQFTGNALYSVQDVAFDRYMDEVVNGDFEKTSEDGTTYFDYRAKREAENTFTEDELSYIKERLSIGQDLTPLEQEFYQVIDKIAQLYWEIPVTQALEKIATSKKFPIDTLQAQYDAYDRATTAEKSVMRENNPILASVITLRNNIRKEMRKSNAGLDGFIYRFGWDYGSGTVNPSNKDLGVMRMWRDKTLLGDSSVTEFYARFGLAV